MIRRFDFAPLDGITRSVYRRVWARRFGGADRIFVPFFSPTHHRIVTQRDFREITRQGAEDLPLALGGSLLIKSAPYRALFLQALESRLPRVTVTEPVMDPAQGALCLAQRLLEEGKA